MASRKIYVADLAAYNQGFLHGTWINLSKLTSPDEVYEKIAKMLAKSKAYGAEEWEIHDYEGFGSIDASRFGIEALMDIEQAINEYGVIPVEVIVNSGWTPKDGDLYDLVPERYLGVVGHREDEYDWAWDYLDQSGGMDGLPAWLQGPALHAAIQGWFDSMVNDGLFHVVRDDKGNTYIFNTEG